jgi:dihydrofolate synthase/folylpolyglutamate synthase
VVLGVLGDKDARGIIDALLPVTTRFYVTASSSDRAVPAEDLAETVGEIAGDDATWDYDTLAEALAAARDWADEEPRRGIVVTGSITLIGDAIVLAGEEGWRR